MVYIKKQNKKSGVYYGLEHSVRIDGKYKKYWKNLGTKIPDNVETIISEFFREIYEKKWFSKLDNIQEEFFTEIKKLPTVVLKKKLQNFSIRFTFNSNKIEGNTLSLRDTKLLLEDEISPGNKLINHVLETKLHQKLFHQVTEFEGNLTSSEVLKWHYELFSETQFEIAGTYRNHTVEIAGSSIIPPHPIQLPSLIDKFFDWVKLMIAELPLHPVEFAALIHLKFVTIHPFSDGNGRISRLLQNYILNKFNYPMLIIDYKTRKSYYNALERSNTKNDSYIFVQWFFRNYLKAYSKVKEV